MMTVATDTQRIYVASLTDYNAGILHGCFIDMADVADIDEVWEKVNAMLAASPEAKAFPQGGPAEEWAIHDYEGFGGWRIGEGESFEKVLMVANLIANLGDGFAVWLENFDDSVLDGDYGEIAEAYGEALCGEFSTMKEYAEHIVDELGWADMSAEQLAESKIGMYLDYDKIANDLSMDHWESNGFVFRSN